jgi:hypothetical protein
VVVRIPYRARHLGPAEPMGRLTLILPRGRSQQPYLQVVTAATCAWAPLGVTRHPAEGRISPQLVTSMA